MQIPWHRLRLSSLTIEVIALILVRAIDQTLYYRIAIGMTGFAWFFSALVLPVAFLVVLTPVVLWKIRSGAIPRSDLAFPQRKIVALGMFDSLYNVLSTFPVAPLGGPMTVVLSQTVMPLQAACNYIFLKHKYGPLHMVGIFLAVYAVLLRMLPQLTGDEAASGGTATGVVFIAYAILMVVSNIPSALGNVYKEAVLKHAQLNEWYLNVWVAVWQLLFGILTVWTVWIPGQEDYVAPGDMLSHIRDGFQCFLGHAPSADALCGKNDTASPGVLFLFFIGFNIAYNLLVLRVIKRGTSTLMVVASAVRLPLVDIMLTLRFLAGPAQAAFTAYDGMALLGLMVALYVYNLHPEDRRGESEAAAKATSSLRLPGRGGGGAEPDISEHAGLLAEVLPSATRGAPSPALSARGVGCELEPLEGEGESASSSVAGHSSYGAV